MTYEEAIGSLRYRWHDLRINPNDLPNAKTMNFSKFQIEVGNTHLEAVITPSFNSTKNFVAVVNGKEVLINSSNVTAWREVKLFESEVKV